MLMTVKIDGDFLAEFDRVAKAHQRDRSKEIKRLMLEDIRAENPEYKAPEDL
jgi:metal-responsive CopG/Arc/MetJ family transcriptional regulator